ncbi:Asp-tRNA(Asn)/Glu-tRNA(Gln) amidotransferase subunit GatA [Patescibacteria group bacterium]|nr:MAG: Asp-tRNA(Asn)/Glu-tRNA(Gln) amidotransferase subunit GatA [Patescibacteria group bacterium]
MDIKNLTLIGTKKMLDDKELSARELWRALFDFAKKENKEIHGFLRFQEDESKWKGLPIAVKDNMLAVGMPTTCASKILENYQPSYQATVIDKLEKNGLGIFGKTNMDEFAMGSSTESSAFGITKNPHDLERVPGGSSGGSAAAVASGMALAALGSDTGGSIRQPASFCGVVGLKPTYGRVSRYGLVAMASSLDQIGTFTKDVKDAAYLLNIISGFDKYDSTSSKEHVPNYLELLDEDVKGLRIGVPKEYFIKGMDADAEKTVRNAIKKYESLGAEIVEISLPHTEYALAVYYILMPAEVSSNLARFDGIRYGYSIERDLENGNATLDDVYKISRAKGFGAEPRRRIMLGTFVLSHGYYDAYYLKAQKVRTKIIQDFNKAFEKVDVIATPTSPTPAFKIGEKISDPLTMYLSDIFTVSANLAGVPALSLPCGIVEREGKKLPVGLQLIGKHFDESTILRAAHSLEQAL